MKYRWILDIFIALIGLAAGRLLYCVEREAELRNTKCVIYVAYVATDQMPRGWQDQKEWPDWRIKEYFADTPELIDEMTVDKQIVVKVVRE